MRLVISEIDIGGVYFLPLLFAGVLALAAATAMAYPLNRYRHSRLFYRPPLAFQALAIIHTRLVGIFASPVGIRPSSPYAVRRGTRVDACKHVSGTGGS